MATLRNQQSGETYEVTDADAVRMNSEDPSLQIVGDVRTSNAAGDAPISVGGGYAAAMEGQAPARAREQAQYAHKESIADKTSTIGATVRGGLSGLSGGLSDELFDPEKIEADELHHGFARDVGIGTGVIAPFFVGDAGGLLGGAKLADDGLSAERSIAGVSSKFLHAGELGGEVGTTGRGVERTLARGQKVLTEGEAAAAIPEDLAQLDVKGLRQADKAERESLAGEQVKQRAAAADGVAQYRATVKGANPWLVIDQGEDAAKLNRSSESIRTLLNDPVGLAERPESALKALRIQEQALMSANADAEAIGARLAKANGKVADEVRGALEAAEGDEIVLTGKSARRYGEYSGVKVGRAKDASVAVAKEDAAKFLGAMDRGEIQGAQSAALQKLPELLDANRSLQSQIKAASLAKSELSSARLEAIANARDQLVAGGAKAEGKSWLEHAVGGAMYSSATAIAAPLGHLAPLVGAKASKVVTELLSGGLAKTAAAVGKRSKAAVSAFFDVSSRAGRGAPILATRVLSQVRYAAPQPRTDDAHEGPATLAGAYRARSAEIRSQTMYGPDGKSVMRPEARMQMATRLDPVRQLSPVLADRMETLAARRLQFLASKLIKRPDLPALHTGPDNWQPSDMQMRGFARYAAAVEDPGAIEERLAHGTITPEDAEVMREVYPERLAELQRQVLERLPTLQQSLPYARRLSLSILTGMAVDPSMDPAVLNILQRTFAREAGTEGGTQAPMPQPQFGSVKADIATPAQQREGANA